MTPRIRAWEIALLGAQTKGARTPSISCDATPQSLIVKRLALGTGTRWNLLTGKVALGAPEPMVSVAARIAILLMQNTYRLCVITAGGIVGIAMGCAVGVKHDYSRALPPVRVQTSGPVAVGTQDLRPYIVSGDKSANFVGLQRGGYGNPFDTRTKSGHPLAAEFSGAILRTLEAGGSSAELVTLPPRTSREEALKILLNEPGDRCVLVTIREWKADTYTNTKLLYDVSLEVFGESGEPRAASAVRGSDDLGGSFWDPPGHARDAVPAAFQDKLGELLGDRAVMEALR